jgi:hypothetical protein
MTAPGNHAQGLSENELHGFERHQHYGEVTSSRLGNGEVGDDTVMSRFVELHSPSVLPREPNDK